MKTIIRFILAILIITLAFAIVIGLCYLLGTAAHAIGFLPWLLEGGEFEDIIMDGGIVICVLSLIMCFIGIIIFVMNAIELK